MSRVAAAVTDHTFLDLAGFTTGAGEVLPEARLAYQITGNTKAARANGWTRSSTSRKPTGFRERGSDRAGRLSCP